MTAATSANNKRIAKNTLMLYLRMLVMMGLSLFTSRVVLQTLGIDDFGIYNVIGGVILFFSFINSALMGASQRFLNYEMGRGNDKGVERVFSMSLTTQAVIALVIVVLAETVGLWFVYHYLQIPVGRMEAALWVFHCSVAGMAVGILQAPYYAAIIAYERMSAFAYISIVEAVLKLAIVYLLLFSPMDKLKLYALLMLCVIIVVTLSYVIYCRRHFQTTRYRFVRDGALFRRMFGFSGWSLFGSAATIGVTQGLNVLQNIFFGVVVNAAMGVAMQVNAAVTNFSTNFQTAFKPQIVKSYAADQADYLMSLVARASKISYFLMFALSLPIILCSHEVLALWLTKVPDHAAQLVCLMLVYSMVEAFSAPLWMLVQAVGTIRSYQLAVSFVFFLVLPVSYVALRLGAPPEAVVLTQLVMDVVVVFVRLYFVKHLIPAFPLRSYLRRALWPAASVTAVSVVPAWGLSEALCGGGVVATLSVLVGIVVLVCLLTFALGFTGSERSQILAMVRRRA